MVRRRLCHFFQYPQGFRFGSKLLQCPFTLISWSQRYAEGYVDIFYRSSRFALCSEASVIWCNSVPKRLKVRRRLCRIFPRSSRFPLQFKSCDMSFYFLITYPRVRRRLCRYFFRSSRFALCSEALVIWCYSVLTRLRVRRRLCRIFPNPQGFHSGSKLLLLSYHKAKGTPTAVSIFS